MMCSSPSVISSKHAQCRAPAALGGMAGRRPLVARVQSSRAATFRCKERETLKQMLRFNIGGET